MSQETAAYAASETPDNSQWNYIAEVHQFQITVDGKQVNVSTLEAVMFVLQQRYVAMSDVTAEKTREMQEQVDQIKEANAWLNAAAESAATGEQHHPPDAHEPMSAWMTRNGLDPSGYEDPMTVENFRNAQAQISNYVDQLSSNNDLRMLSLKTAVNKAQQAMMAADGVLQNIKQLMQTIAGNIAR